MEKDGQPTGSNNLDSGVSVPVGPTVIRPTVATPAPTAAPAPDPTPAVVAEQSLAPAEPAVTQPVAAQQAAPPAAGEVATPPTSVTPVVPNPPTEPVAPPDAPAATFTPAPTAVTPAPVVAASPSSSTPQTKPTINSTQPATTPVAATPPSDKPVTAAAPERPSSRRSSLFTKHRKLVIAMAIVVLIAVAALATLHIMSENTWKQATADYDKKDYASAAKKLDGVSLPNDQKRLMIYSQSMLATRQLDKAMVGYQKLYELSKDQATKLTIANIYTEQKNTGEAIRTYQEIITADPSYSQAYVNLSTLYRQQGKTAEALALVQQGIAKNPDDTALLELRVTMLLDKKGSPEYQKAVDDLRKLNADDPLLQSLSE